MSIVKKTYIDKPRYSHTIEEMAQVLDEWGVSYLKEGDLKQVGVSAIHCKNVQELLDKLDSLGMSPEEAKLETYIYGDEYDEDVVRADVMVERFVPVTLKESGNDICEKFDIHVEERMRVKALAEKYGYKIKED